MTTLRLRLEIANMENLPQYGAVANIHGVPDRPGSKRKSVRDLVIPVGYSYRSVSFQEVELDPGRYIVEAILPSGQVIVDEVSVEESAIPQELLLRGDVSPHEWLGWQHFVGNVEQNRDAYSQSRDRILKQGTPVYITTELVSVLTPPPAEPGITEVSTPCAMVSRGFFFAVPSSKNIDVTRPLSDFFPFGELHPPAHVTGPLQALAYDEISMSYGMKLPYSMPYREERYERHYFFIRGEGLPSQYSVLPAPWMQADHSGEAYVEALVRRSAVSPPFSSGFDPGHRVAIVVHDRLVGSIIGYLGAGKLPTAATMMKTARETVLYMLEDKLHNPLVAAAGAYVLLSTEDLGQPDDWQKWVKNLMNWFKWLPDGAIQHAWVKMNQQDGDDNLREARASLLEGYRRGLPFYSKGVGMLLDGLTLFANDARAAGRPDKEVEEALRTVRQLALRTNMRQPFTTVLLR